MPYLQNRSYYIQPTREGTYIILIRTRTEEARAATVIYDGRENALFLRRPKETILLGGLNPTVRKGLVESAQVAIMELNLTEETVERSYRVPVQRVDEVFVV